MTVLIPPDVTPQQGVGLISVGGTGIQSIPSGTYGGYIWNPLSNTDQGIVLAEALYVNPLNVPDLQGFGATIVLQPGDYWLIPLPKSTSAIYVNAATSGHRFTSVYWVGP